MVAYRTGSSYTTATSETTTVIPTPTGMFVGDRMFAFVGNTGTSVAISAAPSGWTQLATLAPSSSMRTAVYYLDPTGTQPSSYTWTWSVSSRQFGVIVVYSGVDTGVAPTVTTGSVTTDTSGPNATPSATLTADDWLLTFAGGRESPGTATAVTWTSNDGSDTERYELTAGNTGTGQQGAAVAYDSNRALAAGSHSRTVSSNKTLTQMHLYSVRIKTVVVAPTAAGWSLGMPIR